MKKLLVPYKNFVLDGASESMLNLTRGLSLKDINVIGLLSLVCFMRMIIAGFLRYTGYLNFIKNIEVTFYC